MQKQVNSNDLNPNGAGRTNALKDFQLEANTNEKSKKEFGERIILQVHKIITSGYFTKRNQRFGKNRELAHGRLDVQAKFADLFNIDGKTNYVNLIWKTLMIANTIISRLVGRWMTQKTKPRVTAVDPVSVNERQKVRDEAEFYMDNKEVLSQLSEETGVQTIPSDQFIPDDKDHLDLWNEEENRTAEEILSQKGVSFVLDENSWDDVLFRKVLHDSAEVGLIGIETIADKNGKVLMNYCKPENMFYSYSEYPDFRDSSIKGEIVSRKISDLRCEYPNLTMEELYEIAKVAREWQHSDKITFNTGWNNASFLPFDDWNVDVVRFTLVTTDDKRNLFKVGKNGKMYVDKVSRKVEDVYEGNEYVEKTVENVYRGVYVRETKFILEWGLEKNMIKPRNNKYLGKAYSPYSFYMYQNNQMRNLAVPEKIEEPVYMLILIRLKIQQLIAKMRPAGYEYDIDGLQAMDLGNGILKPLELMKVTDQTGNVYKRSRDREGNRIESPVRELTNAGSVPQLQALINQYNYHLQVVMSEVGSNEFAEGQTIKPRTGVENVQTSLEISFNATDYMRDSVLSMLQEAAKKVICLLHDSIEFGSKQYRGLMQETDVEGREFDVKVEMLPTTKEITDLENMINNAFAAQPDLVLYLDPQKIKRIAKENVQLAELYFRQGQKRAIKGRADEAERNSKMNSDAQVAAAEAKSKGDADLEGMKLQSKLTENEQSFVQSAMLLQMVPTNVTPDWVQEMINIYLEEIKQKKQAEAEQMAQQQAQSEE